MTVPRRFNIIRFPEERRMGKSINRDSDAKVVILPVVPRVHPDWRKAQVGRLDGIALLFKLKHPSVACALREQAS